MDIPSTIAYVKSLPKLVKDIIKRRKIVNPFICFGIDGGDSKLLLTMQVTNDSSPLFHDLSIIIPGAINNHIQAKKGAPSILTAFVKIFMN